MSLSVCCALEKWSCFGFLSEFSTQNGKKCAKSVEVP